MNSKIRQPADLEMLKIKLKESPFTLWANPEITQCEEGECEFTMEIQEHFKQHNGFVHGAIIGFAADSACCWAAASLVGDVVTSEYKINFIAPAVGEQILAKGSVIKSAFNQVISRADIFTINRGRETMVATALATVKAF